MRRCAAVLLAALAAGCGGGGEGPARADEERPTTNTAPREQQPAPITDASIAAHLRAFQRIADEHDGNRAAGTPGDRATVEYIARELRDAGWRVRFQDVRFPFFEERGRPQLAGLERGEDFEVLAYSPTGRTSARVRPLDTQACTEAALEAVQEGEIALVARGTCTFRAKALNAERAGAAALLVVDRESEEPVPATLGRPGGVEIPVLSVTGDAAARLARREEPVELRVDTVSEQRTTRNVVAETAPAPDGRRTAMAGAHLDSVAAGPGINDNASGVAALLESARRLARRPGLRLGFWGAEELGLHGSRAYVDELSRQERREIAAYVNLDMVGSPNPEPEVYDTDNAVERALRRAFPGDEGETSIENASDHAAFAAEDIPVGGLFTGASRRTDPCYHRACDTVRSADAAMAARMARAATAALPRLGA